jgi:hypothetical protein
VLPGWYWSLIKVYAAWSSEALKSALVLYKRMQHSYMSKLLALTRQPNHLPVSMRGQERCTTDQEGQTMVRGLPKGTSEATCPVRVFEQWVTAAKITSGPIFRPVNRYGMAGTQALSGLAFPRIVKEALTRAGSMPKTKWS